MGVREIPGDPGDDLLMFPDESASYRESAAGETWDVLIVDDEPSVHDITKLVLSGYRFENREIRFFSAYDEASAVRMLETVPTLCLVLLDVVMDRDDTGLRMVRHIREELHNSLIRIILRTGQPGAAPEKTVIVHYDINDYKLKTDLTADQLFVSVISALRSYRDLHALYYSGKGLQKVLDYSAFLFQVRYIREISSGILMQLASIIHMDQGEPFRLASAFFATLTNGIFLVEAGFGRYANHIGDRLDELLPPELMRTFERTWQTGQNHYEESSVFLSLKSKFGRMSLIHFKSGLPLMEEDRTIIEVFCANVNIAMDNVYLGNEIDMTQKEILFTLGEVAEARSSEMGHHVKLVAHYSRLLAVLAGFTEEEAEIVFMAAPIHDIGKLAIPDAILLKPAKLTEREFVLMKTHAKAGADILGSSNSPILKAAAIIAAQHHERYDGLGYPEGLCGKDIHIYGRIVAITDVFDALDSKRPYKMIWDMNEILAYLSDQRGKQFDPVLTDLFLDHLDQFMEIRNKYKFDP